MKKLRLRVRQISEPIEVLSSDSGSAAQILRNIASTFLARGASRRSISSGFIFTVGAVTAGGADTFATSFAGELFRYAMWTSSRTRVQETPLLSSTAIQPLGPTYGGLNSCRDDASSRACSSAGVFSQRPTWPSPW